MFNLFRDNTSKAYDYMIQAQTLSEPKRSQLFNQAIRLIGNPTTSKQRYILAISYYWLGANYRKDTIKYLTSYIQNGIWEGAYVEGSTAISNLFPLSDKENHIAQMYEYLANAYDGEYEFEKAVAARESALSYCNYSPTPYIQLADTYRKLNRLDLSLQVLKKAKQNALYKLGIKLINNPNYTIVKHNSNDLFKIQQQEYKEMLARDFASAIDIKYSEIENKIDNGYIYRPRKRKE